MNRNRFLAFLFSLVPGCGLMYLGYMKKGLQFMATFAAAGFIGGFLLEYFDWFGILFFVTLPIIWFYQMFDAMHTVERMKNHGIELPADDGFIIPKKVNRFSLAQNRMVAKIVAGILILVGSVSLVTRALNILGRHPMFESRILSAINSAILYNLVPAIVSIILIIIGIMLLKGGKIKKMKDEDSNDIGGELS